MASTALLTDRYEYSNLQSAIAAGVADTAAVFTAFTRRIVPYGVVAGIQRIQQALLDFKFDEETLAQLTFLDSATLTYLKNWKFTGSITAYREGSFFTKQGPVVQVEAPFGQGVLLETLILSILNHDCAIATQAHRMVQAAQGKPLVDMGTRRVNEHAAVAGARAAYIAGFAATSNLQAGLVYGVPTMGTAAHCYVLAAPSEYSAFFYQAKTQGADTTFLVDTFDTLSGVSNAILACKEATGLAPGAIRIDSGDKQKLAWQVRGILDSEHCLNTQIVVSGEVGITELIDWRLAPIDKYGIGTQLYLEAPVPGFVYKLVEIGGKPVAKTSPGKESWGGRKVATRRWQIDGPFDDVEVGLGNGDLQHTIVKNGIVADWPSLDWLRHYHKTQNDQRKGVSSL